MSLSIQSFGTLAQSSNSLQTSGPPPFTKSTKFNDLPDDIKKSVGEYRVRASFDFDYFYLIMIILSSYIQGRVQICKDLQQRKLGDQPTKGH